MNAEARFTLQRRIGIIFAGASVFFALARAFSQIFILNEPISTTVRTTGIVLLLLIGIIAVPTIFFDHLICRLIQSALFLSSGVVLLFVNNPGNLTGVLFYAYGLLVAIRYGFFKRYTRLKSVIAFLLVVVAAGASGFFHKYLPLPSAIVIAIAAACFFYLYWIIFTDEMNRYRLESLRLRREAVSNQVFVRFGQNIAGIVHNVKSKLMSIEGFNDLMTDAVAESSDSTGEYASLQRRGIRQLSEMIDGLLLAVRSYQRSVPETMPLGPLVRSAVEMLKANRSVRSGIRIDLDLCEGDGIYAVPLAVIQILDAFIQNAWESLLPESEHRISIATRVDGSFVACSIEDRGRGLPFCTPCEHEDCMTCPHFQFGRTTKPYGSGIGVVHARTLIAENGGRLKYESSPGMGTRVSVWFPRMEIDIAL